jgi:O-antigen biosynthesis alpha-1,2-mannosyltransferase
VRVALDATYSVDRHPSGIAIYSQELLSGLARRYEEHEFVHCYRLKQWRRATRYRAPNVEVRPLVPPLPTFRADIFHALNQRVDTRPAKIVISTFHDLFVMTGEYSTPEFRVRFTKQARQAASLSDLIIAVSEFTARQVVDLLNVERTRIRVVPHGVDQPTDYGEEGRREREKLVLFVGALQVRKNVVRLARAFEQTPLDWRLVLAGSPDGYGADRILEEISDIPADRIRVTGYVSRDDLLDLYSRASIFAFPSLDEGFGIPVLEAMAHGVPVVTSNRSALAEVAGHAALLVNPEQTDEIAAALNRLIGDADLRAKLAAEGRSHAEAYTWKRSVSETFRIYEDAMQGYF